MLIRDIRPMGTVTHVRETRLLLGYITIRKSKQSMTVSTVKITEER